MTIAHPFKEGERVHFAHHLDLEAGLRHGYLEQYVIGDTGILNRVIRYQPESETYLWYEAPMGIAPSATKRKTYASMNELLEEIDVHVYVWYPLFPRGYMTKTPGDTPFVQRGSDLLDLFSKLGNY